MTGSDKLWVPVITHYREEGNAVALDGPRMFSHMSQIRSSARQYLIAGSTGDGWEMNHGMASDLVDFAFSQFARDVSVMFGALGQTTDEVILRAEFIQGQIERNNASAVNIVGLAVCPQVDPGAGQEDILMHYRAVLDATQLPIAVYELPQVTGCSIEPSTMQTLAADPRVIMCKDTSGLDRIAQAGVNGIVLVRGAEENYFEAMADGNYAGLLLSSGNNFSPTLRRILACLEADLPSEARALSDILSQVIRGAFSTAAALPFGNPFSNANKGIDHLLAHGRDWRRQELPLTISGQRLPEAFLEELDQCCLMLAGRTVGYL